MSQAKMSPVVFGKTADGNQTIRGVVHSIRIIPTKSGIKKLLVNVGDAVCKMLGPTAERFVERRSAYEGREAEFYGRFDNSGPGCRDFIVAGTVRKLKTVVANLPPGYEPSGESRTLPGHGFTVKELGHDLQPEPGPELVEPKAEPIEWPASAVKLLNEPLIQYWIDTMEADPFRYPKERVEEASLEVGWKGEAARRIIASKNIKGGKCDG